jgi:large conductance mechanosensitive channel
MSGEKRGLLKDFKEFAFKGNVVDMAVGVMIGAAFGKIVASLVGDLFTPLLSALTGQVSFSGLSLRLGAGENAPVLTYGAFLQTIIDFLLVALCIFFLVKGLSKLKKKELPVQPAPPPRLCPFCKTAIDPEAVRCPFCTSMLDT